MKKAHKKADLKQLYPVTFEKSLIATLVILLAVFHFIPAPVPKGREQIHKITGFIIEDVPITRYSGGRRRPSRPAVPIPVDDPSIAMDEIIDSSLVDFSHLYGKGSNLFKVPILQPRPIIQVVPEYPENEKKRGTFGNVIVNVQVDSSGNVISAVAVKNTTGSKLCEEAAISAAKRFHFLPAYEGTKAVKAWTSLIFGFQPPK